MISVLKRLFIREEGKSPETLRAAYGMLCGGVGIFLNICLFIGKYITGFLAGSIGIMADAFNNLSDAAGSVITLVGFQFGSRKADKEHPFGHGRYEYISGLAISVIILLVGYELARSSIGKIIAPEPLQSGFFPIAVLVVSILVKFYMYSYNTRLGKKLQSPAMRATAADCLNDCLATGAVLVCILLNHFAHINLDGWCGLFVAGFIFWAGFSSMRDTVSPLLGKAPDPELVKKIEEIACSYDDILSIHDLVVHDYGPGKLMLSFHAEVPGHENIYHLHDVIEQVEADVDTIIGCKSVVHMDPVETDNDELTRIHEKVVEAAQFIDKNVSVHDVRMLRQEGKIVLLFDAVLPLDSPLDDALFRRLMESAVHERVQNCTIVMKIDRPYT